MLKQIKRLNRNSITSFRNLNIKLVQVDTKSMTQARESAALSKAVEKALDSMNLQGTSKTLMRKITTHGFGDILKALSS